MNPLHQNSWIAGVIPIILEVSFGKSVKKAYRIENLFAVFVEKITVVPTFEFGDAPVESKFLLLGESFYFGREIRDKFLLRDATYSRKILVVRDVLRLVLTAENRGKDFVPECVRKYT
jgi:hypothetical protein